MLFRTSVLRGRTQIVRLGYDIESDQVSVMSLPYVFTLSHMSRTVIFPTLISAYLNSVLAGHDQLTVAGHRRTSLGQKEEIAAVSGNNLNETLADGLSSRTDGVLLVRVRAECGTRRGAALRELRSPPAVLS